MTDPTEIETVKLTEEEEKARHRRNRILGLLLFAFVGLIMLITMLQLSLNVASRAGG